MAVATTLAGDDAARWTVTTACATTTASSARDETITFSSRSATPFEFSLTSTIDDVRKTMDFVNINGNGKQHFQGDIRDDPLSLLLYFLFMLLNSP